MISRIPPILAAIMVVLGLGFLCVAAVAFAGPTPDLNVARPTPASGAIATVPPVVPGSLNGLPVQRVIADQRPVAVILDNLSPDTRPQAGISQASLTFETVVEGGITRLMSLFLEKDPTQIGPIRSARPYFVTLSAGYKSLLVHAGGSPAALDEITRTPDVGNVDALTASTGFHRTSDRIDPHNLYGTTAAVRDLARQNKWDSAVSLPPLLHKDSAPLGSRGNAKTVSFDFTTPQAASGPAYAVTYKFNRDRDTYLRFNGGAPTVDSDTGQQIEVNNVVAMETEISPVAGDTQGRVNVKVTGTGPVEVFRDGQVIQGTWSKTDSSAPLRFLAADGSSIPLNTGNTWVEIVPAAGVHSG